MSLLVLVVTIVSAGPALALGIAKASPPLRWDQRRRRLRRNEVVDRLVVIALRVGILLLLLMLALVAGIGSTAAMIGDRALPNGVVVSCVVVVLLALLIVTTFARPRR